MLEGRLASLCAWLDGKDWLVDNRFTAADLMMTAVLRELADGGLLNKYRLLGAYVQRGEARPAFGRAMEAQLRTFRDHAPADA